MPGCECASHDVDRRPHDSAGVLQGDEFLVALDGHAGILLDLNLGLMQRGYAAVAPAISNASRNGVTSPTVNGPNSP